MKCFVCGKIFYTKRNLMNLFIKERDFICNECTPNKILLDATSVIIEDKDVIIYSVGKKGKNELCFLKDYCFIYSNLTKDKNTLCILYNVFLMNDSTYDELKYHIIANPDKKVCVLCNYIKN